VQGIAADPTGAAEGELSEMGHARAEAAISGSAVGSTSAKIDEATGKARNVEAVASDPGGAAEAAARAEVESAAGSTVSAEASVQVETEPKK